ncbi:hypothetical protein FOA52_013173 [Chlamydomonas sp. UWO 241]|nr:hypothetical protein FOA52_013173 [Chlamydomonas sp. UWO 241]
MATSMAKSTMSSRAVGISARAPTMRVNPTPARMVKVNFFSEEGTRDRLAGKKPTPESRREAVAMLDALIAQRTAETEIARAKYEAQGMKALDAARKAEHGSPDLSASRAEAVAMLDAMRNKTAAPAASSGGNNWNSYEGSSAATKKVTPTGDSKSRSEAIAALDAMMAERNAAAAKAREAYVKGEATKTAVKAAAPAAAAPAAGGNNWNSYEGSAKAAPKVAPSGNSVSRAEAIAMLDNLRAQREAEAARAPAPAAPAPAAPASSGGNNWNSCEGSSKAAPKVAPSGNSASHAEAIAMLDDLRAQRQAGSLAPAQQLWRWLDANSKVALRVVSKGMRSLVDGAVQVVASPRSGASAIDLTSALLRWPGVRDLTLLHVSSATDLTPLSTASLAGLTSLTVRQAILLRLAFDIPPPSSSAAATLRVIDVSGCWRLRSIDFVRSCVQLRLRKLDLRDCRSELISQVEGLQRGVAGTQLADPQSVMFEGLVHELLPNMPPDEQVMAVDALGTSAASTEKQVAIAAAGAIPPLEQLLKSVTPRVRAAAARALHILGSGA